MKADEVKLESDKRRLKEVLDASEGRGVKLELQQRGARGELQRSRLGLSDREARCRPSRSGRTCCRAGGSPGLPRAGASWGPALPSSLQWHV